MNTPTCVKESACVYDVSCVCRSCWFFFGFLSSSHLAFLVLVLVRILALALSPQLLQVCLGLLQRILLHLVLHLVSFKCGLDQKNDSCKCCNTNLMRFVRTILGSRNKEKLWTLRITGWIIWNLKMVVKTAKIYPQSSFQYMLDILKKKSSSTKSCFTLCSKLRKLICNVNHFLKRLWWCVRLDPSTIWH